MKINIDYIDNEIIITDDTIFNIEIENKTYFYRLRSEFNAIANGELVENINFVDKYNNELTLLNRIDLYIDYFNIDFNSKKVINSLYKMLKNNLNEENKIKINNYYSKIKNILSKTFIDYNLSLVINDEFDLEMLFKMLKVSIKNKDNLFDNLLLLIDINSIFNINELLVFINLKQYLTNEELKEFYKYSLYNNVKIILIDSQSYGTANEYEKKLIIDNNLDEFLL